MSSFCFSIEDALAYGASCPSHTQGDKPFSEDCHFLNIWTPTLTPAEPLPVLVWVHGGSYLTGSGSEQRYNGTSDARGSNLVIVTINYRLGVFGYLGSEQLRNQTFDRSTGNWGQDDQRVALAWVRDHIGSFGGDSSRVMLIGGCGGKKRSYFLRHVLL